MKIKKLKVTLRGPIWRIHDFEIEGVDVIDRWEEDTDNNEGSVTVTDFELSADDILDVFIKVGAPNHSVYSVILSGKTEISDEDISDTTENIIVKKNGRLNILLSKPIADIIK